MKSATKKECVFKEREERSMEIINLTPHEIKLLPDEATCISIPASGIIARVATQSKTVGEINGIPVKETVFGEVENLPDPQDGIVYLVSSLVAQRCRDRRDVFVPNESVRDSEGRIIGCRSLGRV